MDARWTVGRGTEMTVRPFDPATLPRVRGDIVAARHAAVRFGAAARSVELTVARFGRVSLTFSRVLPAGRPAPDESLWRLRRSGSPEAPGSPEAAGSSEPRGWLVIAHAAGLRIVSAILGIPNPRVHRPLGTTERGVLAAAISAVARHVPGLALAGAREDEWTGSGLARIEAWAESETFRESFFLDVPPSWIPNLGRVTLVERLQAGGLPFSLSIELTRTVITADEWSRARTGDAVVFDDEAGDDVARGPRSLRVVCGDFAAPATLTAPGAVRLTGGFAPIVPMPSERNPMANQPDRDITTTVLAAAPIEVVAELGRVTMRADEVGALQAGAVISLPAQAAGRVELRIGERLWAHGELVDVDGQLGVRLTSVAASLGRDIAGADTLPR